MRSQRRLLLIQPDASAERTHPTTLAYNLRQKEEAQCSPSLHSRLLQTKHSIQWFVNSSMTSLTELLMQLCHRTVTPKYNAMKYFTTVHDRWVVRTSCVSACCLKSSQMNDDNGNRMSSDRLCLFWLPVKRYIVATARLD